MNSNANTTQHNKDAILKLCAAAGLAAAVALTTLILPAEYGWDPLGTGQVLGLLGLSEEQQNSLQQQPEVALQNAITFTLAPFESVEYKYRLEQHGGMIYAWKASGEVLFDMHSEPDNAAPGFAQSFDQRRATEDFGTYVAPFSGIHGWFWQNRGQLEVTIELETQGFYPYAVEMSEGRTHRHTFKPASVEKK